MMEGSTLEHNNPSSRGPFLLATQHLWQHAREPSPCVQHLPRHLRRTLLLHVRLPPWACNWRLRLAS
jgi:hypothetical protein